MQMEDIVWALVDPSRYYDPDTFWARVKHKGGEVYAIAMPTNRKAPSLSASMPDHADFVLYTGMFSIDREYFIAAFELGVILADCTPLRPFHPSDRAKLPFKLVMPHPFDDPTLMDGE